MTDPVNAPAHYQSPNGVECIEAIKAAMTPEEFFGYLRQLHQVHLEIPQKNSRAAKPEKTFLGI